MTIDVGAAPACGRQGAAAVATRAAAIETIRAGYTRYIITGSQYQNNVRTTQLPGQYSTSGSLYGNTFSATSTYTPGPTIVAGSHDRMVNVVMFNPGDPGFEQGIDARQALGPKWEEMVKSGIRSCL